MPWQLYIVTLIVPEHVVMLTSTIVQHTTVTSGVACILFLFRSFGSTSIQESLQESMERSISFATLCTVQMLLQTQSKTSMLVMTL